MRLNIQCIVHVYILGGYISIPDSEKKVKILRINFKVLSTIFI